VVYFHQLKNVLYDEIRRDCINIAAPKGKENSQAKGLVSDRTLESGNAPTK
jgi:hypothetical protein